MHFLKSVCSYSFMCRQLITDFFFLITEFIKINKSYNYKLLISKSSVLCLFWSDYTIFHPMKRIFKLMRFFNLIIYLFCKHFCKTKANILTWYPIVLFWSDHTIFHLMKELLNWCSLYIYLFNKHYFIFASWKLYCTIKHRNLNNISEEYAS